MTIQYERWNFSPKKDSKKQIAPLKLHNDFNDNSGNNNKTYNNDAGEDDNVNNDSLNPRDSLDDLLDKTG